MSGDMFSNAVEKNSGKVIKFLSYNDIELLEWKEFASKCKYRRHSLCITDDYNCDIDRCGSWQLVRYIKFGILK